MPHIPGSHAGRHVAAPSNGDLAPSSLTPSASNYARIYAELPGPPPLPIVGNIHQITDAYHVTMEKWAALYGPLFRFRLGRRNVLGLADFDLIHQMLTDRPDNVRRSSLTDRLMAEMGVIGVFNAEGSDWRTQRKLVMRALTPEMVRTFFPNLVILTRRLLFKWNATLESGQQVDVLADLEALTLDTSIWLAMGQDINTLEHHENALPVDIGIVFDTIGRRGTMPVAYWRHFMLPSDRRADVSLARVRQAVDGFIRQTRDKLKTQPLLRAKPSNLLEALVAAAEEPGSGVTDAILIGNAITLVFAGEDTTSHSLAWLLYLLAKHPAAAAKVAGEADRVLGANQVLTEYAALETFPYLEAATKETMRLKPVAPFIPLEPNRDMVLGDTLIPRGTGVVALTRAAAHRKTNYIRPEDFDPDRWSISTDVSTSTGLTRQLLPFGGGQRFCPGRFFALAEMTMFASMISKNFDFTLDPGAAPVEEKFGFTMTPSALPLRLKKAARHL
ncbi:MAG: cytochrome [Herminiimonas sp.]|nr:cytochrome [Herminiimonas sp.]